MTDLVLLAEGPDWSAWLQGAHPVTGGRAWVTRVLWGDPIQGIARRRVYIIAAAGNLVLLPDGEAVWFWWPAGADLIGVERAIATFDRSFPLEG